MKRLFRVYNISTGKEVADIVLESTDYPTLLSDTYRMEEVTDLPQDLLSLKEYYKRHVNDYAGLVRERFLYNGFGQELTYTERDAEANAFKANGYSGAEADFPYIYTIAGATGFTKKQVCNAILVRSDKWRTAGSSIEAQRERGMRKIDNAVDEAEAKSEKDGAISALDAHRP